MADRALTIPVAPGEEPWTKDEIDAVRKELIASIDDMREELFEAEEELQELFAEGVDGAGRDAADVGTSNFERDQEMSVVQTYRDQLEQAELALSRFDSGKFGSCESCGEPIGKGRLSVFPRATMCRSCKQKSERRL